MKLNVGDTIILSLGIGSSLGFIYFLFHGWYADSYFPGMFALGFFLWFLYRKGENFQENRKR